MECHVPDECLIVGCGRVYLWTSVQPALWWYLI